MRLYRLADLEAWDALVDGCPDRTFFHRSAWLGAVAEATDTPFRGAVVEFSSDKVALVPILPRRIWRGLVTVGHSGGPGALGGYGGVVSPTPLTEALREAAYAAVARTLGALTVWEAPRPGAKGPATRVARLGGLAVPAPPSDMDLLHAPGPAEFHADRLGRLEPRATARPRWFYYALFRRAREGQLALVWLEDHRGTQAAVLLGREGDTAHNLGLFATAPRLASTLLAQVPRYLKTSHTLDLGYRLAPEAVPADWRTEAARVFIRRFGKRLSTGWKEEDSA